MPVNRNALIRFKTLDNCFRNRQRRWTLDDLMEACSEALYEYEGIHKGVSRRTVQMDIQMMRSDKLGYNAPITVLEKKYYTYEDPEYSITNIPLTDQDLGKLTEVVGILRQFKGFSHFQELSGMVQRLENKIHSARTRQEPVIDFEKNEDLKGLEHIETLYQAIIQKKPVELCYQSFKARSANTFVFHAYYLKEYRNRWFVLGIRKKDSPVMNLALDRIVSISESAGPYIPATEFDLNAYFRNVIGVTVSTDTPPEKVVFSADRDTAPYIITKPLHHSQEVLQTTATEVTFSVLVQINFELERELLGFGDRVKVVAPERLKRRIKALFEHALDLYRYEFNHATLQNNLSKLEHKGYSILHHVYGKKEIHQMKLAIHHQLMKRPGEEAHGFRRLLDKIPELKPMIFNSNLRLILRKINPDLFLTKALYFDKTPEANWYVTWHQDTIIHVRDRKEAAGFTGWTKKEDVWGVCPPDDILKNTVTIRIHLDDTPEQNGALQVVPGSHRGKLLPDEIQVITQNSLPTICEVDACGIQLMKPLLLHASSKSTVGRHRRIIHLEFNSMSLPNGLEWAEKLTID